MKLFDDKENQFIISAIDAYVRQNGIQAARMALTVVEKLQLANQAIEDPDKKDADD